MEGIGWQVKWLVEYYEKNGLRWDFDCVVIDELSSFKNHQAQRFKWLRKVRPFVKRWIGLTGTPTSNGLMDLWAEIGILDGGERLGRFIGRFRECYFKAGSMNPSTGVVFSYVPRPGAEEQIYQRISDITISMKAIPSKQITGKIDTEFLASFSELPGYKVLLCHHPEYYCQLRSYPINLFLSGHCHGGQIRICNHGIFAPGQGLLPRYHHGVYDGRLVVSSGCANTASIPRFGNEPEVVVVRVGERHPHES